MDSHTVPEKLLKQFAFEHPKKGLRLWRYQKGRAPYWDVSPSKATVIAGHFSDPRDAAREESIEVSLNQLFENPVHDFIEQLSFKTFVFAAHHTVALAPYIALLWHRSKARKAVTSQHHDLSVQALEKLKNRDDLLGHIASSWTLGIIKLGWTLDAPVGKHQVVEFIDGFIARYKRPHHAESSYADTMERVMTNQDNTFDGAQWGVVHTEEDKSFVIGDAPVVTWRRDRTGVLNYGVGFQEPNVEVLLPISPMACLHVLPSVQRTLIVRMPTASEVNAAQAAFAEACYTNIGSNSLDQELQPHFGEKEMGINAFSIRHRDYVTAFSVLLSRMEPPPNLTNVTAASIALRSASSVSVT
ncbi:MAG TPA: DUF4238 domain-containing protein [Acidobacteriaceae bacterium]